MRACRPKLVQTQTCNPTTGANLWAKMAEEVVEMASPWAPHSAARIWSSE